MLLSALFRLAFASAPRLYRLTSQHNVTRRPVLQKVRHHARVALCLLVSTRFQVLFHSPPGVLFTFPSRYYSLSVTWSYLAFGDGPPVFRLDFSCPGVLRIPLPSARFRLRDFYPLRCGFPTVFDYLARWLSWGPYPARIATCGLGSSDFARHYSRNRFYFLFLRVLRCFSSPGSPHCTMDSCNDTATLLAVRSRIRISADLGSFAAPRSFSQLVTSFFGAMYLRHPPYALCSLIFLLVYLSSYFQENPKISTRLIAFHSSASFRLYLASIRLRINQLASLFF